jgi:hypothetical protein
VNNNIQNEKKIQNKEYCNTKLEFRKGLSKKPIKKKTKQKLFKTRKTKELENNALNRNVN